MKNRTSIWGTKPRTAPTPAKIPSATRPVSQSAQPRPSRMEREPSTSHSLPRTSLVQSVRNEPKGPMAIQYTAHMITAKMGRARTRLVTNWSILSEVVRLCLAAFFTTQRSTTLLM